MRSISHHHNLNNQRTSMRDHFAGTTAYTYNARGLPYQITDRNSGVTEYAYYPNGALYTMTYPNGAHAEYIYNERDWLTDLTHRKANNDLIAQFIYVYDPTSWGKNGTRTGMTEEILTPSNSFIQAAVAYTYDDAYRLTGETRTGDYAYAKGYTYDLLGNRQTKVDGSTTTYYHYDYDYPGGLSANKLMDYGSSPTAGSTSNTRLAYDSAGNLTIETPPNSGPVTGYEWDWANRLVRATLGSTQVAQFAYDGTGLRRSATLGTNDTVGFQYAGRSVIAEEDNQGILSAFYTQGQLGIQSLESGSVMKYYHGDGTYSIRSLTDSQSLPAVTDAYAYDASGNVLGHLGATQQPCQYVGALGYYDHYESSDFRLLHLSARYYDPVAGRFVSRDPAHMDMNAYAYAGNSPTMLVDPSGEVGLLLPIAGCIAGAIPGVVSWVHMSGHDFEDHGYGRFQPNSLCKLKCKAGIGCGAGAVGSLLGLWGAAAGAAAGQVLTEDCERACDLAYPPVCWVPFQPRPKTGTPGIGSPGMGNVGSGGEPGLGLEDGW